MKNTLSARIQKGLAEMTKLGIPVSASLRSAENQGINAKLKGTSVKWVNTAKESDDLPRLMSQGYQILIF